MTIYFFHFNQFIEYKIINFFCFCISVIHEICGVKTENYILIYYQTDIYLISEKNKWSGG